MSTSRTSFQVSSLIFFFASSEEMPRPMRLRVASCIAIATPSFVRRASASGVQPWPQHQRNVSSELSGRAFFPPPRWIWQR